MATKPKEMPYNLEAEQSVLGSILIDQELQGEILAEMKESDFYPESHKLIAAAMKKVVEQGHPVDFVTLTDRLDGDGNLQKAGGIDYVTKLTSATPSAANYRNYLEIVKRDSVLRQLIRSASEIDRVARETSDKTEALGFAEKKIFDISASVDTGTLAPLHPAVAEALDRFNTIANDKNAFHGIPTGFRDLDEITNGLHATDLVLIAARPAMGKTSFAMNLIAHAAVFEHKSCAVFSLEMPRIQIAQRLVCSLADVSMAKAMKGELSGEEWKKLWNANKSMQEARIFVDDSSLVTPADIQSKCRRLKMKEGLDLVMIDYIQLMSGGGRSRENRQQEVADITRNLKVMAKELQVPVIALSQLNRTVESSLRPDHRPQLSDLRESGAIEQDADIVMFIHRPDKYLTEKEVDSGAVEKNVAEIIIAKHRNGGLGTVKLYFKGETTTFQNMAGQNVVRTEANKGPEKLSAPVPNGDAPGSDAPLEGLTPPEEEEIY